jgi:hypothetical protein
MFWFSLFFEIHGRRVSLCTYIYHGYACDFSVRGIVMMITGRWVNGLTSSQGVHLEIVFAERASFIASRLINEIQMREFLRQLADVCGRWAATNVTQHLKIEKADYGNASQRMESA